MRLPAIRGEWIDRARPVEFRFEGRSFAGYEGDTVSSALWAADVRVLGRSFKYHRPRGVLSLANHDTNAIHQWGDMPNLRADVTPLVTGMDLKAVNTFGSLANDKGRVLGTLSRFLPVGFYYKAFHNKRLFPLWERMFRTMTGLGRVDFDTVRQRTPKAYDFCDVLVIGGGPSGLSAALAAAAQGADVVVVDENARLGGSAGYQLGNDDERARTLTDLLDRVAAEPRIRVMTATVAAGYYKDHWIPLVSAERMVKMRATSVVLASGAFEQPAVFHNNDLPGVMLASAAQRLIYRYAVKPVQRAVVLAANADGYRAALDLLANGVAVAALVDLRATPGSAEPLARALKGAGVELLPASCIVEGVADAAGLCAGARVGRVDADGKPVGAPREIACDGILISTGWAPAANLLYQAGTRMRYDTAVEQFVPDVLPEGVFACGRVNGVFGLERKLADGARAGSHAAAAAGFGSAEGIPLPPETESPSHPWPIVDHPAGKNFVDFDEDLQFKDFCNAVQEGFDNIELLKRFSTNGMGPSQGKHSNMNGLRILARLNGKAPQEVGTTTARPFFHPVPMAILAGRGFNPERRTPLHTRHEALGAKWMPAGVWQRPEYYQRAGISRIDCIRGEAAAVRSGVGIIDVGTLGKLEVIGPQAAEFLERVYTANYANLKVGMTRYAVMCDETGVVIDDGVVARLAEDHFYFTTTTSGAATIYRELSRLNTIWGLDCGIVNHTGAFAAVNLAGPKSRVVLARLTGLDLSADAFPYLAVREGEVAGIPARLMRVGFVGEWGYEIHVPANQGLALWDALLAAGADDGIRPFGVEAQRLLRLEKGHIIIGQDTDGLTTPLEAGLNWALKMNKPFFVGQRSLEAVAKKPLKQTLVGISLAPDHIGPVPLECHLVIDRGEIAGRVTSIAFSPSLNRHIGLAFVRPDLAGAGNKVDIRLSGGAIVQATITTTPFYDPENLKQKEAA
ncbi:FAD-dependent oxidoreductase [Nitrogeniibacter mangrovi]|uniref:FAD-dependent oxidoreductase n=1 Tax=Nitrogeniibacter mangrovi TaxID=2016596 RepID=A0A6C1B0I7_9RHOO|nr:FAD-dependent oxidoreductase [Nitrogeniibacter mangrovi]QID17112.1 FAD-dependent oxidoreductase [Nitrogeniibacter mangrovi]